MIATKADPGPDHLKTSLYLCEIRYKERTGEGLLRQRVFPRLRDASRNTSSASGAI